MLTQFHKPIHSTDRVSAVQKLARALVHGMIREISPLIRDGQIRYADMEKITGLKGREAQDLLDSLESDGILLKKPFECLFACPYCRSFKLLYRVACNSCHGRCLVRGRALEHMHCGYVDMEEAFMVSDGFKCPKCRKNLKAIGVDYRVAGKYYCCLTCNELQPAPEQLLHCLECSKPTSITEANLPIFYSYSLNPSARDSLAMNIVDLSSLSEILKELGFEVELDSQIIGKCGVSHSISLLAYASVLNVIEGNGDTDGKRKPEIIVDTIVGSEVIGEIPVLSFMAKVMDIGSRLNILAAVPRLSESARKLVRYYNIRLVESENIGELSSRVAEVIKKESRKDSTFM